MCSKIVVENFSLEEENIVNYSLLLISGHVEPAVSDASIEVNLSSGPQLCASELNDPQTKSNVAFNQGNISSVGLPNQLNSQSVAVIASAGLEECSTSDGILRCVNCSKIKSDISKEVCAATSNRNDSACIQRGMGISPYETTVTETVSKSGCTSLSEFVTSGQECAGSPINKPLCKPEPKSIRAQTSDGLFSDNISVVRLKTSQDTNETKLNGVEQTNSDRLDRAHGNNNNSCEFLRDLSNYGNDAAKSSSNIQQSSLSYDVENFTCQKTNSQKNCVRNHSAVALCEKPDFNNCSKHINSSIKSICSNLQSIPSLDDSGECDPLKEKSLSSLVKPATDSSIKWPVVGGKFKALVELKRGINFITLTISETSQSVVVRVLYLAPAATKRSRFVRPVYIVCCDDADGRFQGPEDEDCSKESALRRIAFSAKLLQTFTAEKLYEHFGIRKTFTLEMDIDPQQPSCHVFTSKLKVSEAHQMSGNDLWMHFARELMTSKKFRKKSLCKWFAFMSFTHYMAPPGVLPKSHSDVLNFTKGHTALGGGGLALYGSGTLNCWAEGLTDITRRFSDMRKICRSTLMDDSAYREYRWANYSTGLGAALHELGHTFDLAHTPTGIMSRGFDDIHRLFIVAPSRARSSSIACESPGRERKPSSNTLPREYRQRSNSREMGSPIRPDPTMRPRASSSSSSSRPADSIVQVESSFRRLHSQSTQTTTVKNYDGSELVRTVTRHRDGVETIAELTTYDTSDRKVLFREFIKNPTLGTQRTTISMHSFRHDSLLSGPALPQYCNNFSVKPTPNTPQAGSPQRHKSLSIESQNKCTKIMESCEKQSNIESSSSCSPISKCSNDIVRQSSMQNKESIARNELGCNASKTQGINEIERNKPPDKSASDKSASEKIENDISNSLQTGSPVQLRNKHIAKEASVSGSDSQLIVAKKDSSSSLVENSNKPKDNSILDKESSVKDDINKLRALGHRRSRSDASIRLGSVTSGLQEALRQASQGQTLLRNSCFVQNSNLSYHNSAEDLSECQTISEDNCLEDEDDLMSDGKSLIVFSDPFESFDSGDGMNGANRKEATSKSGPESAVPNVSWASTETLAYEDTQVAADSMVLSRTKISNEMQNHGLVSSEIIVSSQNISSESCVLIQSQPMNSVHHQSANNVQHQPVNSVPLQPVTNTQPVLNVLQQPDNYVKQQSINSIKEQCVNKTQLQPVNIVEQRPVNIMLQQPVSIVQQQPVNNVEQQLASNVNQLLVDNMHQQPVNIVQQPGNNVKQNPTNNIQQQSVNNVQKEPVNNLQQQLPVNNMHVQPVSNVHPNCETMQNNHHELDETGFLSATNLNPCTKEQNTVKQQSKPDLHEAKQIKPELELVRNEKKKNARNDEVFDLTPMSDAVKFQDTRYKDGGAHWYRSSAVLLRYHKWFNDDTKADSEDLPSTVGNTVHCPLGIRLIELRSVPEGTVFHHWEFLHSDIKPPVMYRLDYDEVMALIPDSALSGINSSSCSSGSSTKSTGSRGSFSKQTDIRRSPLNRMGKKSNSGSKDSPNMNSARAIKSPTTLHKNIGTEISRGARIKASEHCHDENIKSTGTKMCEVSSKIKANTSGEKTGRLTESKSAAEFQLEGIVMSSDGSAVEDDDEDERGRLEIGIFVEDDCGNVAKKRIQMRELRNTER